MSLGIDILEAVKCGGLNKWKPQSIDEFNDSSTTDRERNIDYTYSMIGGKRWTVAELYEYIDEVGEYRFAIETVRDYMNTLLKRGMLKRYGYPIRYHK